MKLISPLIETISESLDGMSDIQDYLGVFSNSDNPAYTPKAIAYNTLPINYTVPNDESCFIVFSIETVAPQKRESAAVLQEVGLKLFIGGYDADKVAEVIIGQWNNTQLYNYVVSYSGINYLPEGNINLRFNLI